MSHAVVLVNVGRQSDLVEQGIAEEGGLPSKALLEGRMVAVESGPLAELMAPYDENTEVPRYRDYDSKREKARKIESVTRDYNAGEHTYKATLDARFTPPITPREEFTDIRNVSDVAWKDAWRRYEIALEAIADLYTDEEVAAAYNAYWAQHGGEDTEYYVSLEPDDVHETRIYHWSTYNPQSKWDWYVIGGRWSGALRLKRGGWRIVNTKGWDASYWSNEQGWADIETAYVFTDAEKAAFANVPTDGEWVPAGADIALARDIDWDALFEGGDTPGHAYVDKAEGWVENGKMIWFGMSTDGDNDQATWVLKYRKWTDDMPADSVIVAVDYHI